VLAAFLALSSALLYAAASVLQHRAAVAAPAEHSMRLGLLVRLAGNPIWLAGLGADAGGYVAQFAALDHGSLVLVQPLLVSGMFFALPLGAWLAGARLTTTDWCGALAVCGGLAVFLLAANPAAGRPSTSWRDWVVLLAISFVATVVLVVAAGRRAGRRRAILLAAAAGVDYGLTAALTKATAHLLGLGVGPLVTHWQPYVLIVAGAIGMVIAQSAFQAGSLDASLPTLTVMDPAVSIAIGAAAFGEVIAGGATRHVLEVLGVIAVVAGVRVLGRSSAVQAAHEPVPT
jgi:drug/metabolite transporter (DMT)-like permease